MHKANTCRTQDVSKGHEVHVRLLSQDRWCYTKLKNCELSSKG